MSKSFREQLATAKNVQLPALQARIAELEVKAANEFGITKTQRLAALLVFINDIHSLGLLLATGRKPNTAVIGAQSMLTLANHPQFIDKIKYVQKGIVNVSILAELLDIENVVVGEAVFQNELLGQFGDVWLDNIVLAYVAPQTASRGPIRYANTPSYGYTLRKPGFPQVDSYLAHGGKVQLVRNTDFYRPYITWAEAGYLIQNTKA